MKNSTLLQNESGVTLIELLLAIILSSIVIMGVFSFFNSMNKTATGQSQINDMHENAEYALRRLSEDLSAAGAGMNSLISAITLASASDVTLSYNPRGGSQTMKVVVAAGSSIIPVDSGAQFLGARFLAYQPFNSQTTSLITIDTAYNTAPFSHGIRTNSTPHEVRLTPALATALGVGDIINSIDYMRYYLNGTDLCRNSNADVVAENIDSIAILLQQLNGTAAANWQAARVISITVRAKTAIADPAYTGTAPDPADHFRRITMSIRIPLKNKV